MKATKKTRRFRVMADPVRETAANNLTRVIRARPKAADGTHSRELEDLERRIDQGQNHIGDNLIVLYLSRPESAIDELCIALKASCRAVREAEPTVLPFHDVRDILRAEDQANTEADRAEREVMADPSSLMAVAQCAERTRKHLSVLTRAHDALVAVQVRLMAGPTTSGGRSA